MLEGLRIELALPEQQIESEIEWGMSQKDIAMTYAMAMDVRSQPVDWARINNAIRAKWPKGLIRVKQMAHKIHAARFSKGGA